MGMGMGMGWTDGRRDGPDQTRNRHQTRHAEREKKEGWAGGVGNGCYRTSGGSKERGREGREERGSGERTNGPQGEADTAWDVNRTMLISCRAPVFLWPSMCLFFFRFEFELERVMRGECVMR